MIQCRVLVINKLGLHARAASKFVQCCSAFGCTIRVGAGDRKVDGKSIMSVMMLAAGKGTELELEFDGDDEEQARAALCRLIEERFGEPE